MPTRILTPRIWFSSFPLFKKLHFQKIRIKDPASMIHRFLKTQSAKCIDQKAGFQFKHSGDNDTLAAEDPKQRIFRRLMYGPTL